MANAPHTKRRRSARKKDRPSALLLCGLLIFSICCSVFVLVHPKKTEKSKDEIIALVEYYAAQENISDHINELKAIVSVESNWESVDVFQSSESLGLPPNSLSTVESVRQGVSYYASLLERAEELGVDQDAVFQAYNYGSGYLDYVAAHGKKHTRELAEAFSKEYSNGVIVAYPNPVAISANGGWRYQYGNMFYVDLIHQIL